MKYQTSLQKILSDDPVRMKILYAVRELELNDGWIGQDLYETLFGITYMGMG